MRRAAAWVVLSLCVLPATAAAHPWDGADNGRSQRLDRAEMRQVLRGSSTVEVPRPGGGFATFTVRERPVLAPLLQAKHPEIRTYAGRGVDDRAATVSLDLTPQGFHAAVRAPGGGWFVDPRDDGSYVAKRRPAQRAPFEETEDAVRPEPQGLTLPQLDGPQVRLRTYRLAFLTGPSYAAYHGAANVLAAKATLINRVTQIYEDEFGARLQLINADLEFNTDAEMVEPGGPCGSNSACFTVGHASKCSSSALNRAKLVIGLIAGAENFDIGHLGIASDTGGGTAGFAVAGRADKARGCTGLPAPTGDSYAVDYVAHELGHQFGGSHTFNGNLGSCGGNWVAGRGVEPGSGSTIMGYAGICSSSDDLQPHSDPYFSQESLEEMGAYMTTARPPATEVQITAFNGFFGADSFTLTVNGVTSSRIVRGQDYSSAAIQSAIEEILPGSEPEVANFDGLTTLDAGDTGFQVTLGGGVNVPRIAVTNRQGFTSFASTIVRGGPVTNGGHTAPLTANRAPVVTAAPDATIPIRTPFALTGSATDQNNDPLVYSWEQKNPGVSARWLGHDIKPDGPLFRVLRPTTSPTRTFPDLAQIVAGNTNVVGENCFNNDCFSEWLPTDDYPGPLKFRLTARDLNPAAGGTGFDDTVLALDRQAGPFRVTSQATPQTAQAGVPLSITWDVAGTDGAPVGTTDVRITLSTDGGLTFPHVLSASTPNDGSESLRLPNQLTEHARIRVQAVGNVFFDVSHADLTIEPPGPTPEIDGVENVGRDYSDPVPALTYTVTDPDTPGEDLTLAADGLPIGIAVSRVGDNGATTPGEATYALTGNVVTGASVHTVTLTATDGSTAADETFSFSVSPELTTVTYTGDTRSDANTVTLSAGVVEQNDGFLGDLTKATVTFREGLTVLCSTTVGGSCTAQLGEGTRTIDIKVGGSYYTGDGSSSVTVGEPDPPTVTNSGDATVQYTESPPPITVSATDPDTPLSALTATASGLPGGLSLTPGAPGTWTVTGQADADPDDYPVTATVSDSELEATTSFTVTVTREDATVAYVGPAVAAAGQPVAMATKVTEPPDGTPGDLRTAIVAVMFPTAKCAGSAAADGTATCSTLWDPAGFARFGMTVGGRYTAYAEDNIDVSSPFGGPMSTPTVTLTPTPTPTVGPVAVLKPDLGKVAKRAGFRRRAVRLRLGCSIAQIGAIVNDCAGTAKLLVRGKVLAATTFAFPFGQTRAITLTLGRERHRKLEKTTRATLSVRVGQTTATKAVTLRR